MYIFWKKNCGSRKEIQIPVQIGDSRTVSKRGDPGFVLSPSLQAHAILFLLKPLTNLLNTLIVFPGCF